MASSTHVVKELTPIPDLYLPQICYVTQCEYTGFFAYFTINKWACMESMAFITNGQGVPDNSELMQMVYLRFPVPKHMLVCARSSYHWELAIVISVGEGSVCGITARSLITRRLHTYVYSGGVLRGK